MSGKITVQIKVKVDYDPYREVEVNECLFRCYESGKVERHLNITGPYGKKGDWRRCDTNNPVNNGRGRSFIQVKTSGKMMLLHRIIYFAFNPTFDITDTKNEIDHINRNSLDNRIVNLREATHGENQCNKKATHNNKMGLKNIRDCGTKWRVKIDKDGKQIVIRYFDKSAYTLDDVIQFRNDELLKHHGEFANLQ